MNRRQLLKAAALACGVPLVPVAPGKRLTATAGRHGFTGAPMGSYTATIGSHRFTFVSSAPQSGHEIQIGPSLEETVRRANDEIEKHTGVRPFSP